MRALLVLLMLGVLWLLLSIAGVSWAELTPMRYMVIETFLQGAEPVYARAAERGRMLPDGLVYVDSWVDARTRDRCFQLMETDDPGLFEPWIAAWSDLAEFEVVPVVGSAEAARMSQGTADPDRR